METKFLKAALFGGMTADAFKLGTVLSLGWFWLRTAGCHIIYRGQDGVFDYDALRMLHEYIDECAREGKAPTVAEKNARLMKL